MADDRGARRSHLLTRGLRRAGLLSHLHLHTSVLHNGRRIKIPLVDGHGLQHRELTEPHAHAGLRAGLELREGVFIDVGAHLGETLVKLMAFGTDHSYLGFEPNVLCAAYIDRLLAANAYPKGSVIPAALGARCGVAELLLAGPMDDSASIVPEFRGNHPERAVRPVPLVRGDDVLEARGRSEPLGVLKIDTEGAELDVLRGFHGAIERDQPVILCEILPLGDSNTEVGHFRHERARGIAEFAAKRDYALLVIESNGLLSELPTSSDPAGWTPDSPTPDHALVPLSERDRFVRRVRELRSSSVVT